MSNLWEMVKDREAWRAIVHGVAKSRTQVSDWTESSVDVTYQILAWELSSNWWLSYPGCFCFGMVLLVWQGWQIIWGRFLNGNVPHQFHDIPLAVYQLHHPFMWIGDGKILSSYVSRRKMKQLVTVCAKSIFSDLITFGLLLTNWFHH